MSEQQFEKELEKIVNIIINDYDTEQLRRYLLCTSPNNSGYAYFTFDGIVTDDMFNKLFYTECDRSIVVGNQQKEYQKRVSFAPNGRNTFYIVGYQGCGKTTFINKLIQDLPSDGFETQTNVILTECDRRGVATEEKPLRVLFAKELYSIITKPEHIERVEDFIAFYDSNIDVFLNFACSIPLGKFREQIINYIHGGLSIAKNKVELDAWLSDEKMLNLRDILYLIFIYTFAMNYRHPENAHSPLLFVIDNLDMITNYYEVSSFIAAINDLSVDMNERFKLLSLYDDEDLLNFHPEYTHKVKIIVTLRESTSANLPTAHLSNLFYSIMTADDASQWYKKGDILLNKLEVIQRAVVRFHNKLKDALAIYPSEQRSVAQEQQINDIEEVLKITTFPVGDKKIIVKERCETCEIISKEIECLIHIADDDFTSSYVFSLFNNDYRTCVTTLSQIVHKNESLLRGYKKYGHTTHIYGIRGILLRLLVEKMKNNQTKNYFEHIGFYSGRSICRTILSYLSNYTDTRCDTLERSITLKQVLDDILSATNFTKDEIIKSVWEMYELQSAENWSQLVSFSSIEWGGNAPKTKLQMEDITNHPDYSKIYLHYTCAGKMFLELIATHFETIVALNNNTTNQSQFPLFSFEASILNDDELSTFEKIIEDEYHLVNNIIITLKRAFYNEYSISKVDSRHPCNNIRIKPSGKDEFNQYYEDRLINAHIVYLDRYRLFLLGSNYLFLGESASGIQKKVDINTKLVNLINKFVSLWNTHDAPMTTRTEEELLPMFRFRIAELRRNPHDFKTPIAVWRN